jgi:DNA-binding transcriptional regulator YiaG
MKNSVNPSPSPSDVLAARHAAGLTQAEAAKLVHTSLRAWQQWEYGERRMHPAMWELFCLKLAYNP